MTKTRPHTLSLITRQIIAAADKKVDDEDQKEIQTLHQIKCRAYLQEQIELTQQIAQAKMEAKKYKPPISYAAVSDWLHYLLKSIILRFHYAGKNNLKIAIDFYESFQHWESHYARIIYLINTLLDLWKVAADKIKSRWNFFSKPQNLNESLVKKLNDNPDKHHFTRLIGVILNQTYYKDALHGEGYSEIFNVVILACSRLHGDKKNFLPAYPKA
jgi:hypothetical protein